MRMVVGPAQMLTRYHDKYVTHIRPLAHGEENRLTKVSGFVQVDIGVPNKLYKKFIEMALTLVAQGIPESNLPEKMRMYKASTDRKTLKRTKKLVAVMKATMILLYTPMIC